MRCVVLSCDSEPPRGSSAMGTITIGVDLKAKCISIVVNHAIAFLLPMYAN